ncbi:diacylglycerol kinase family protein [Plebeiibacterium sediminum]|uniref:Diacylglycerol kinase family protein n=1 Tax=Plebeiibacterium sediminum TaxID=2992112 RepID=A0AAE3M174_9BACT|nr:diacylglycerol kinase family protein [Plebeiobacterium sediminum]MCW3785228.1 diacylglycerol kinase family protein [Plebeiobacterium sediminum]
MNNSAKFSLKQRLKSFKYAFNGIKSLIQNEHNARIHFIALFCVVVLGFVFQISIIEWLAIVIVSGIVILSELFNTAMERLADFIEPKHNIKIGLIKDYCAGAVLIAAIVAVVVGCIIFIPKILDVLYQ